MDALPGTRLRSAGCSVAQDEVLIHPSLQLKREQDPGVQGFISGNGVDLAAIYSAIIAIDRKVDALDRKVERRFADQTTEVARLRADVAAYHASVVDHGILISELDERVRRLEQDQGKAA